MLTYVCYSHSDYEDILLVQDTFLQGYDVKKILLTNRQPTIPIHFDRVLLYHEIENYSDRLVECFSQIEDEYVLFAHDMDIPIQFNPARLEELVTMMRDRKIDSVGLQYLKYYDPDDTHPFHDVTLVKNLADNYRYNVNPTIWKVDVLRKIMMASSKSYRTIECEDTQKLTHQYQMYKLHCAQKVSAGYFHTTPLFIFLHITHHGELLPTTNNNLTEWLAVIYSMILSSFTLRRHISPRILRIYSQPNRPEHIYEL